MFSRKSDCHKIRGMLSPYIDGELSPADSERVESHVEMCDACRRELESLRETVGLLQRVEMVPPPRSFTIAPPQPARRPAAVFAFAALRAATAFAVVMLVFFSLGYAFDRFDEGIVLTGHAATPVPTADIDNMLTAQLFDADCEDIQTSVDNATSTRYITCFAHAGCYSAEDWPQTWTSAEGTVVLNVLPAEDGTPPEGDVPPPEGKSNGRLPLDRIQIALAGLVVVLGGVTLIIWLRQRRAVHRA